MSLEGAMSGAETGAQMGSAAGPWGALAGGIAGGVVGSASGGSWSHQKRQMRFQRDMNWQTAKLNYARFTSMQAKAKDARKAGLHPLAALGISPGGAGAPGVSMPGQSYTGSSTGEGISRTIQGLQARDALQQRQTHQGKMGVLQTEQAMLGLEEQQLRNDWLKSQILNSEQKRLQSLANSTRPVATLDPAMRRQFPHKPGPNEMMRRTLIRPDGTNYSAQGGTSQENLEALIGEWADWMPHTLGTAYDVLKGQLRGMAGIRKGQTFYDRNIKKGYTTRKSQPRRNVRGKSRTGPRSRN